MFLVLFASFTYTVYSLNCEKFFKMLKIIFFRVNLNLRLIDSELFPEEMFITFFVYFKIDLQDKLFGFTLNFH